MARRFDQLRKQIDADPRRREKVEDYKRVMEVIASLTELRKQLRLTQVQIAERLKVKQPVVSQFESASEINLTTLMRYVEALGGSLDLTVRVDDLEVHLAKAGVIGS
jgi:predicted XRE-type DNA-binding protein